MDSKDSKIKWRVSDGRAPFFQVRPTVIAVSHTDGRKAVYRLQIKYSKSAVKAIQSMDKSMKQRIKRGIEGLTSDPPVGDIKPMQGYSDNRYRLRVGGYRIIYKYITDNTVIVLYIMDIGSRGDIYK